MKKKNSIESFSRVVAELDASALQANYRAIHEMVPHQSLLPMVKANGYGHGGVWAARQLTQLPALYGFGVATFEEGRELRDGLTLRARKTRIIVFSGTAPWTDEKGEYCERYGLTPVLGSDEDWQNFLKGGWHQRISYELKFNTGMNRLGISVANARSIAKALRLVPAQYHPSGILSHLAIADQPESRWSVMQLERFRALRSELSGALPSAHFHLAGSAAIWKHQHWNLRDLTDVVRPGLALYGITPWSGAPVRGLRPVMTLKAAVVAVHTLRRGESLGYGATFTVKGPEPVRVAIIAAGYADGLHRALGNQGFAWVGGREARFVGRVSMDVSAISCGAGTRTGDMAELIGPNVDLWAQAQAAGTIPYELLTSVGQRVQRVYE